MNKLICSLLLLGTTFTVMAAEPRVEFGSIAASVNDEVITQSTLNARLAQVKRNLQAENTPLPPEATLKSQVLNQMITEQTLLQLAASRNITVDDAELNEAIRNIAKNNHFTMAQLHDVIAKQGATFEAFRDDIKRQLIISRLEQQALGPQVTVSEREIDNYLATPHAVSHADTRYHLGHILIVLPENPTPVAIATAKQKAERVLAALKRGANFKQMAVSDSGDNQALQGGDLGWRSEAELPSLLADKVPQMKEGEIIGPLRSASGFHIIKLLGKHQGDAESIPNGTPVAAASNRDTARELLRRRKYNEALQNWIRQVRDGAHVEIHSSKTPS